MIFRPPVWVAELAGRFWGTVPEQPPPFPRDMAAVLALFSHIHVVELPHLTIARATAFLLRAGVPFRVDSTNRPLRGCLAAFEGDGYILFDALDEEAEQRFTVAHELAHFLRDYEALRQRAATRLGPEILQVFDGKRAPTLDERLAGILRGMTVGCHTHLMGRDNWDWPESLEIREAEEAADRLAFELLAPFDAVVAEPIVDRASLSARLVSKFGLPLVPAAKYAAILLPSDFSQKICSAFANN